MCGLILHSLLMPSLCENAKKCFLLRRPRGIQTLAFSYAHGISFQLRGCAHKGTYIRTCMRFEACFYIQRTWRKIGRAMLSDWETLELKVAPPSIKIPPSPPATAPPTAPSLATGIPPFPLLCTKIYATFKLTATRMPNPLSKFTVSGRACRIKLPLYDYKCKFQNLAWDS